MRALVTVSVHPHPSASHFLGSRWTPAGCHLVESKAHVRTRVHRLPPVAVASGLQTLNSARCKCVVNALWHSGGGSSSAGSENEAIFKGTGAAAAQPGKMSTFTACF